MIYNSLRNLTPGYDIPATVIGGPMHGKVIVVPNPDKNPYHRVVAMPPHPPCFCMGFPLADETVETYEYRFYEFVVGDRIRPMLIPVKWASLTEPCLKQRIWNTLLDEAADSYRRESECYLCRDRRFEENK